MKPEKWFGHSVYVNDLLPCFDEIKRRCRAADIPIDDTFGSSSDPPETPKRFILAWGPDTEPERIKEILGVVADLGLELLLPFSDVESRKQLLIGSYMTSDEKPTPATREVVQKLMDPDTPSDEFRELASFGTQPRVVNSP